MDQKEFDRLASISRLRLDENEREKFLKEIDEVIRLFDEIEKADVDSLEPAFHPIDIPQRLRGEEPEAFGNKKELLGNTKIYRFYVVGPKI
jgi:aspartyl/glutamyl-tRNA(Asn/Gln) amidotransferase C subunit